MPASSRGRVAAALAAVALAASALVACAAETAPLETVTVPADAPTISDAVARVAEGGLILVSPGVYPEQVLVDKPGVTVRGLDRNQTVVDGEGTRPYGIVAIADGVSVENLTVTGATFYGVLVTGLHDENGPTAHGGGGYTHLDPEKFPPVQRFSIDHVTAYNNGLYGLYAFDAQHGVISNSYASGSADSGIYVGQCRDCDITVRDNIAENNAVGFENANASDSVYIVGNRFSRNRVGLTLISNYQEAFVPQSGNTVVGNVVSDNVEPTSPVQADGGFGIGIGISGGTTNDIRDNRISGNARAGVLLAGTEDLSARGNVFSGNAFEANGIDTANISGSRAPAQGNCVDPAAVTLLPAELGADCASGVDQPSAGAAELPASVAPPGVSFRAVPAPPPQPQLPDPKAPARSLPASVGAPDLTRYPLPAADLLAAGARG